MEYSYGMFGDKPLQLLILKEPKYVAWLLDQPSVAPNYIRREQQTARSLIEKFDRKPFLIECMSSNCRNQATLGTVYVGTANSLYWWCDRCDKRESRSNSVLHQSGAAKGNLFKIRTYNDALRYVSAFLDENTKDYRTLIREIAVAKGLSKRVTEKLAVEFFE